MEPIVIVDPARVTSFGSGNSIDDLSEKAVREAIARGGSGVDGFGEDEDEVGFVDGVDNPMNEEQEVMRMEARLLETVERRESD